MKNSHKNIGIGLLLGAVAGFALSLLIPNSTKEKNKKLLKAKAEQITKVLTDPDERQRIKEVFQEKTKETTDTYHDIKASVAEKISLLRVSLNSLDKQKYSDTISKTLNRFRDDGRITTHQLKKLKGYLESDFSKIKSDLSTIPDNT